MIADESRKEYSLGATMNVDEVAKSITSNMKPGVAVSQATMTPSHTPLGKAVASISTELKIESRHECSFFRRQGSLWFQGSRKIKAVQDQTFATFRVFIEYGHVPLLSLGLEAAN